MTRRLPMTGEGTTEDTTQELSAVMENTKEAALTDGDTTMDDIREI